MEKYDPMVEFFKQGIPFLFKQAFPVVLCSFGLFVLWGEMGRRDSAHEEKISLLNREWSASLNEARADWRMCEEKRIELEVKFAALKARVDLLARKK